ncbi:MAG: hypothetical protein K2I99_01250 [Bacteroidaceae bacterium]|nr:hypothetical protein [Bacteroidaceae bacterium]
MKKFLILLVTLCVCVTVASAQTKKEQKAAAKQLRQDVASYVSQGWLVSPGHLPLSDQLNRSYTVQKELDEDGFQKYVTGDGMSVGTSYDAAKMQALELAKLDLVQKLQSEIVAMIKNDVANDQGEQEEAVSTAATVLTSKNFIRQKLGRVITLVECYRVKPNKNKEVRVVVACNSKVALEAAKAEVKKRLETHLEELHEQLDAKLSE